jgi:hypothetical protein
MGYNPPVSTSPDWGVNRMKTTILAGVIMVSLGVFALAPSAARADTTAPTTCKDGTTSQATGKGACSGHGGVQKAAKTAPAAAAPAAPATPAAASTVTCKDGTTSTSSGKGTCSGHGGIQKASKSKPVAATAVAPAAAPTPAAAAAAPTPAAPATTAAKSSTKAPTATAGNTDPTGATAKCKDGTYSKSQHHSGTCSSHGGVAEWLTPQ